MNPSGPKNLMPLSAIGLCDALIMTPAAASSRRVTHATAGVGTMPSEIDVAPDRGDPGDDRRFEHRSGETRVAPDDDRRRVPLAASAA